MDEATRVRAGANTRASEEMLLRLAEDPSPMVRATVALNPAAPDQVVTRLARDADERVRVLLARRLAAMVPTLSGNEQARLGDKTYATLVMLVADEAERVRAAVAEELKSMPNAPRELILRLALNRSVMVCEPVLLFSPMLTPTDLVALVTAEPAHFRGAIIARRPNIPESVSDAIAGSANNLAIQALLSNQSAQIREATLDALAERASARPDRHSDWHAPLVRRPTLSAKAAQALSEVVAAHLLDVLAQRTDLDLQLRQTLHARLAARLARPTTEQSWTVQGTHSGLATEHVLLEALRQGDVRLATETLALAATVKVAVIEHVSALRSAKGMVSLVWKAGFSMRGAAAVQSLLARLPPDLVLHADEKGGFPLGITEMQWQIDFMTRGER